MRSVILTILLFFVFHNSFAAERMILVEHFTGASCGPCARQNPILEELLSKNTDNTIQLSYQVNIPSYDPMYEEYRQGVDKRRNYYNINSAPSTILDGNHYGPVLAMNVSQTNIDSRSAENSPFKIELSYEKTDSDIDVTMTITADQGVDSDLYAYIAVIENEITYDEHPGSNNERVFDKVLRQFLPSPDGIELEKKWSNGQSVTLNESWTFENVRDGKEIAVVAFIQNKNTKEVLQSAFAKPKAVAELDLKLSKIYELPDFICEGNPDEISPTVVVTNYGTETVTSFEIECSVNGSTPELFDWSGELEQIEPAIIKIAALNYNELSVVNEITANVVNVNGGNNDANSENDTFTANINSTVRTPLNFKIRFRTGDLNYGFSWRIVCDGTSQVPNDYYDYQSGYKSTDTNIYDMNLPSDCWRFVFKKGHTSSEENFFFEILAGNKVLYRTESVGYFLHIPFYNTELMNIKEVDDNYGIELYPNPASEYIELRHPSLTLPAGEEGIKVEIFDVLGCNIECNYQKELAPLSRGGWGCVIDVSYLQPGIYFLRVNHKTLSFVKL